METLALLSAGLFNTAERDKQMHFIAGTAFHEVIKEAGITPLNACLATLGAGLAKEAWDSTGRGHVEFEDVAATAFSCRLELRF